jgi:hypothetical protein
MHLWQSKKVLKTSKSWHTPRPNGLSNEDVKAFNKAEQEYKHLMLGVITKERKPAGKNNDKE